MTFRITRRDDPQVTVLKIDGWLEAEGLPALERELGRDGGPPRPLALDLAGLRQADEAAVILLRRLMASGARLVDCAPYLALRLAPTTGPDGRDVPE